MTTQQSSKPPAASLSLEEELALFRRGTEEIFPEEELLSKLTSARREGRSLRIKYGIDPTAADIHLGHLIPVLKLRSLQDIGHTAVLIIGDYTAQVGDPSGQNQARPQLSHEQVLANAKTYTDQLFAILDPQRTEVVYNGTWFSKLGLSDLIRLLSQMTVARMLEREDFSKRMSREAPIFLHELLYPLMQGYDSVQVRADVELGGIDQKFNILVGRDLQREAGQEPQVGVCNPILIGTDGKEKMSKSLGNTINFNDPPEEKYGKCMSIPDDLMEMYFELITDVPQATYREWLRAAGSGALNPRDAKRRLARAVVERFHSEEEAAEAEAHFDRVVRRKELPAEMPEHRLNASSLEDGRIWLGHLLVQAGLASSSSEVRRAIAQRGVRIDGDVVGEADANWQARDGAVIQLGKRRFIRIRLVD